MGGKKQESLLPFDKLTSRQYEIVILVARRMMNNEIAAELKLSPHTVNPPHPYR